MQTMVIEELVHLKIVLYAIRMKFISNSHCTIVQKTWDMVIAALFSTRHWKVR